MLKSSTQEENDLLIYPIRAPPHSTKSSFEAQLVPSAPGPASSSSSSSATSASVGRISPIVLLMIVILAAIFFISGCLHLLFRYLMKRPPSRSLFHSNRYYTSDQASTSHALQRQLQQLFRLHDSGLDQPAIDSLPVFHYKDVTGPKRQFECAVCLSEFSNQDKLRLLPICSHAFHIGCIDPWLHSNSTCPLCRGTLLNPSLPPLTQITTSSDDSTEMSLSSSSSNGLSAGSSNSVTLADGFSGEKRVYSIRLGRFRASNDEADNDNGESSKLDGRRCYSMGSYQYVVSNDSYLRVALDLNSGKRDGDCVSIGEVEGKKIGSRVRAGESFSVSKIWLWSKKRKFQDHHHHRQHQQQQQQDSSFGVDDDTGLGLNDMSLRKIPYFEKF